MLDECVEEREREVGDAVDGAAGAAHVEEWRLDEEALSAVDERRESAEPVFVLAEEPVEEDDGVSVADAIDADIDAGDAVVMSDGVAVVESGLERGLVQAWTP